MISPGRWFGAWVVREDASGCISVFEWAYYLGRLTRVGTRVGIFINYIVCFSCFSSRATSPASPQEPQAEYIMHLQMGVSGVYGRKSWGLCGRVARSGRSERRISCSGDSGDSGEIDSVSFELKNVDIKIVVFKKTGCLGIVPSAGSEPGPEPGPATGPGPVEGPSAPVNGGGLKKLLDNEKSLVESVAKNLSLPTYVVRFSYLCALLLVANYNREWIPALLKNFLEETMKTIAKLLVGGGN